MSNRLHLAILVCLFLLTENPSYLKYVSLLTLTFQNALLILTMRYSRVIAGKMYFTTTAVVFSEFTKMVVCLSIILYQQGSIRKWLEHLHEALIVNWKDTLKMSVPAIVYMVQNNLQYVAVSNLEAAVFQVIVCLRVLSICVKILMIEARLVNKRSESFILLFNQDL